MEDRTRAYLRGRFRDHYRRAEITPPPAPDQREWGYIPFSPDGTTMVRHQSLLEVGSLDEFLQRERPRHVYFSAGYYDDPGASTMEHKGWVGSDLVFDLDADHLPSIDPEHTGYAAMLAACKDALNRLLDFLKRDFGFEDLTIAFSGGRGYHVHVRDRDVRTLDREERREIVEYIRGVDVELERILTTEPVGGTAGRSSPAQKRSLRTDGGWGRRVHGHLLSFIDDLTAQPTAQARDQLKTFEGIGDGRATAILNAIENNEEAIRQGNIDVHQAFLGLVRKLTARTITEQSAPIDEPVTTDVHRLIRLPGSLHGGTGLTVTRIDPAELDQFDPLADTVPETFMGHEITIEVTDLSEYRPVDDPTVGKIKLGGDSLTVTEGHGSYPEHLGIFLMARGDAEKGKE